MESEEKNNIKEEIECRNCGAIIPKENMDFEKDIATCSFCGTSHRIHDSVTKHYTYTNVNIHHGTPHKSKSYFVNNHMSSRSKFAKVFATITAVFFISVIVLIFVTNIFAFSFVDHLFKGIMNDIEYNRTTTKIQTTSIKDVDPFDSAYGPYIYVTFYGFNKEGKLIVHIPDKYNQLTYTIDKQSNLSNGEQVTLTLGNTEAYPEYNFKKTTGTATVNGLLDKME